MDMSRIRRPESSVKKQFDLTGKRVVITGGAGFLGRHFAEAVAEMGARPILLDIGGDYLAEAKVALEKLGFEVSTYPINIVEPYGVRSVVNEIVSDHDTIDVLINSAAFAMKNLQEGREGFFADFEDYDQKLWQVSLDVNLTGTFLITQAVGRVMKAQQRGVVINVASDVAISGDGFRFVSSSSEAWSGPARGPAPKSEPAARPAFRRPLPTGWAPSLGSGRFVDQFAV